MKISKRILITTALVGAVAAPAAALTIPPMLPDLCFASQCVQFSHVTALAQIQSLYQKATSLANEARNLKGIGNTARTAVDREVGDLTRSGIDPLHVGDAAAGHVVVQAPDAAGNVATIHAQAGAADGAQAQAQVGNLYLGTIATEAVKANALAAEQVLQEKNTRDAEARALAEIFNGGGSTDSSQL